MNISALKLRIKVACSYSLAKKANHILFIIYELYNMINIVATKSKEMYLAPSHVSQRLFGCDKRLEWVNHSPVADKWVMTDPHDPIKFKINNPLSRIRHRKPATRGRMCSQNLLIFNGKDLYKSVFYLKFCS